MGSQLSGCWSHVAVCACVVCMCMYNNVQYTHMNIHSYNYTCTCTCTLATLCALLALCAKRFETLRGELSA